MSKNKDGLNGHTSTKVRDAGTGQFVPSEQAKTRPNETVRERVPDPGYGQQSSKPIGRDAGNGQFIPVEKAKNNPNATVERIPK